MNEELSEVTEILKKSQTDILEMKHSMSQI
jgi:hypothetical protein